jgi:hypothetical protein
MNGSTLSKHAEHARKTRRTRAASTRCKQSSARIRAAPNGTSRNGARRDQPHDAAAPGRRRHRRSVGAEQCEDDARDAESTGSGDCRARRRSAHACGRDHVRRRRSITCARVWARECARVCPPACIPCGRVCVLRARVFRVSACVLRACVPRWCARHCDTARARAAVMSTRAASGTVGCSAAASACVHIGPSRCGRCSRRRRPSGTRCQLLAPAAAGAAHARTRTSAAVARASSTREMKCSATAAAAGGRAVAAAAALGSFRSAAVRMRSALHAAGGA